MISSLSISGYKCFGQQVDMPLAQITLLYGKNGRGKSSLTQPMLLLSQTMKATNTITDLVIKGNMVDLGTFDDIKTRGSVTGIRFKLSTENESLELSYQRCESRPQLASLSGFVINNEDRFVPTASLDHDHPTDFQFAVTTSDIALLQQLKSAQYVSAERLGPRNDVVRNDMIDCTFISVNGDNVIYVINANGKEFQTAVAKALSYVMDGANLLTKEDGERIALQLNSRDDSTDLFKPVNVGYGYSFVLPIIVSALLSKPESLLIVENPEAHLHPAAQSRLMNFLINQAKEKNFQLIIETHSDHVVNGLRLAMKNRDLTPQDAIILFLAYDKETGDNTLEIIECDRQGELSSYPDDFMDEWTRQLLGLI